MPKYVSIPGSNGQTVVYHTNKDCKRIKGEYREVSERYLNWHEPRLCEWCEHGTQAGRPNE